jgi:hypothetical protein
MTRSLLFTLALAAGVLHAGGAPRAQPAPRSPEQQEADRAFKDGVARFKEGKYTQALAEFERAYQIAPHPLVLYNIAGCYRELARHAEAVRAYKQFLDDGIGKVSQSRLADAQTELARIYAIVARVTVTVEPASGASLYLDGELLGALPLEMPLILPAGLHKLRARAPGRADAEDEIRVAAGEATSIELTLPELPPDPGQPGPGGPTVGVRPGPDTSIHVPGPPPVRRAAKRFAVNLGFGTNARRVSDTGLPSLGLGLALGSRLELGLDATLVAYAIMPSLRVRLVGDQVSLHAIAVAPIAFTDGGDMDTFVAGGAGLGLRMYLPWLPGLALRLESYASFGGETHGTTIPTFLGGELWF